MDHRERLAQILRTKSLMRGDFTLSSGKKSNYYLDCRLTTLDPEGAFHTGYAVFELLNAMGVKADAIGGLSMGADPIVSATIMVSFIEKKPIRGFLVRKERKAHGRQKRIEGIDGPVENVVIVDDACTTGASTQDAIDAAVEAGYKVVAVISLVDREEGGSEMLGAKYNYRSIFTARELLGETGQASASKA
jgi:orotate phosphoribosyltransferase